MFISDILKKIAAALLLGIGTLHAAGVVTADGVELAVGGADATETAELLKAFDRQLCTVFRVNSRRSPIRCRITASPNAAPGGILFRTRRNQWDVEFNTTLPGWREDPELWRRLAGILLLAKHGAPPPENPAWLPAWLSEGILAQLEEQRGAERLLRRNRQYLITRALLAAKLPLPDFRYMTGELDPSRLTRSERKWYREFSRLLLDILGSLTSQADNALLDYALLSADPKHSAEHVRSSTIERVLRNAALRAAPQAGCGNTPVNLQRFLENCARRTVWHLFAPMPPEFAEARFREINQLELPVLDANRKPTGKIEIAPLDTLPDRLIDRPDGIAIRDRKIREIHSLPPGNSPEILARCRELGEAIRLLPLNPEDPARAAAVTRFRKALSELENYFPYRIRLEEKLDDYDRNALSSIERYADRIEALRATPPFLTEKAAELLERVEKRYLDE